MSESPPSYASSASFSSSSSHASGSAHGGGGAAERLAAWHAIVRHPSAEALGRLLAEDVVFHSPVVHAPQRGRAITTLYLMAAFEVLAADAPDASGAGASSAPRFRYVREVVGERDAVLEFMTEIDGTTINGVDMIRWNDAGQIVDFKVMVRPKKAMEAIHAAMGAMLARLKGG